VEEIDLYVANHNITQYVFVCPLVSCPKLLNLLYSDLNFVRGSTLNDGGEISYCGI
jgi:hypothetical protein